MKGRELAAEHHLEEKNDFTFSFEFHREFWVLVLVDNFGDLEF